MAVALLAPISAAVYYLIDDARAFAFFALVGLELVLDADHLTSRRLSLLIVGVAFEQIHPLFPFALQLEESNIDCLLQHSFALTSLAREFVFGSLHHGKGLHIGTNSLDKFGAEMEGVAVGAGDLAFVPRTLFLHAVRTGAGHIPRETISTSHACLTIKCKNISN